MIRDNFLCHFDEARIRSIMFGVSEKYINDVRLRKEKMKDNSAYYM